VIGFGLAADVRRNGSFGSVTLELGKDPRHPAITRPAPARRRTAAVDA
jgi:hypothetical protein